MAKARCATHSLSVGLHGGSEVLFFHPLSDDFRYLVDVLERIEHSPGIPSASVVEGSCITGNAGMCQSILNWASPRPCKFRWTVALRGWPDVLEKLVTYHAGQLRAYPLRHLVLLIDFDDQVEARLEHFKGHCPADVADRVYILGTRGEPEQLKQAIRRSLEKIGQQLADGCVADDHSAWGHELLVHNMTELTRLAASVKPFLFSS